VATARHAITEGLIDLVGMTRAHIADPHLVEKIAAGEEHRIRPCVGATHCMSHRRPTCLHNPATGHEAVLNHRIKAAASRRRVVIVGAGPAGLEAARVAAARGHKVTLFEAAPRAGGQVLLASRAHWRRDMIGIVDWRIAEIEQLGVDLRCGVFAEAGDVLACNPDLVIIATGGVPNIDRVPGGDELTSPWDIIQGTVTPAADVLVIDGTGRHVAMSAADVAHAAGARVSLVTIDETLAMEQAYAERVIWRKWAAEAGIETTTEHALVGVRREGNRLVATLRSELTGSDLEKSAAQVIFDYGTVPADALFHELAPQSRNDGVTDLGMMAAGIAQPQSANGASAFELHRIGDAVASRNVNAAVTDALRLCQNC